MTVTLIISDKNSDDDNEWKWQWLKMIDAENDNDIYNDKDTGNNTDNREL